MSDEIHPITLDEIRAARTRIAGTILRTPLVKLELGPGFPDIRLKLENLQPINAYKLRGAANAVAMLSDAERKLGVWTISAGNAGPGRRLRGAARPACPARSSRSRRRRVAKLERMRALGATLVLVPYDRRWKALEDRAYPGVEGTFIHPFDDHNFIAGHATMGLEILEDAPDVARGDRRVGGGGLITGVGSAMKALRPDVKISAPSRRPPRRRAARFAMGSPQAIPGVAGVVRRRRRRPERLPAHVGADAAAGRRQHRRQPR